MEAGSAVVLTREDGAATNGIVTDISETGMFVATPAAFVLGERLRARFVLPGSPFQVHSLVEVRAVRAPNPVEPDSGGVGVSFETLDEGARAAVEQFIRG